MGPITVRLRAAVLSIAACALLASGCGVGSAARAETPAAADPEAVRRSLFALAADSMEGRMAGTPGAARAARFIADELRRYGVPPAYPVAPGRDSAYYQGIPLVRSGDGPDLRLLPSWEAMDTIAASRRVRDVNVVGVIRGADPRLREEAVIIGAHYDHVGIGRPVMGDSIYNGADDDASGVVTVLEVARALAGGPPPRRTMIFLLTSAEEMGLLGTRWYIQRPVAPISSTVGDLQVEMVARPDSAAGGPGRAWLTGYERSSLGRSLAEAGIPIGPDRRPAQRFFERSDNIAFACRGIPAHTLSSFGMHGDYHQPSDEVEAVDLAHLTAVVDAAIRAARVLADGDRPVWSPEGDPSRDSTVCGG